MKPRLEEWDYSGKIEVTARKLGWGERIYVQKIEPTLEELGYVQKNDAEDGGISYGGRSVGGFCILEE